MSMPRTDDCLIQALASLPAVHPEMGQAEAVRARCRARLERRPPRRHARLIEAAVFAAASGFYGLQLVRVAALLWR